MIRYEVVLEVDPARAAAVAEYMRDVHIPEIFATGCFPVHPVRAIVPHATARQLRRPTTRDLEEYLRDHSRAARGLSGPVSEGVAAARETWTESAVWE
jgi:hypothetical protein